MCPVSLFDKESFEKIEWPANSWANKVRSFFSPILNEGVTPFISNVKTQLFLLKANDLILPITVNEKEYKNSYIVSNYYGVHLLKENMTGLKPLVHTLLTPAALLLKFLKVNKVVNLNTWFFPANIPPKVTGEAMKKMTAFLEKQYPDHVFMFRSVNNFVDTSHAAALSEAGYFLFPTRSIFFYNPHDSLDKKARYHRRRDTRLFEQSGYEVVTNKEITDEEIPRLLELYQKIYMDKYTSYSPSYTSKFLKHLISNDLMQIKGLKKNNQIDAVIGYHSQNGIMQVPFIGYDTSLPATLGLYRMISLLGYLESDKHGLFYHDGNGAEAFKLVRGLKKTLEYAGVYSAHLKKFRYIPWRAAEKAVEKFILPKIYSANQSP
ncbi:MAG: hypothetical protein KDK55_04590 [Chlamydiia bacterium]|nr:hypothetical protein [Chlamydiia bacterium]